MGKLVLCSLLLIASSYVAKAQNIKYIRFVWFGPVSKPIPGQLISRVNIDNPIALFKDQIDYDNIFFHVKFAKIDEISFEKLKEFIDKSRLIIKKYDVDVHSVDGHYFTEDMSRSGWIITYSDSSRRFLSTKHYTEFFKLLKAICKKENYDKKISDVFTLERF